MSNPFQAQIVKFNCWLQRNSATIALPTQNVTLHQCVDELPTVLLGLQLDQPADDRNVEIQMQHIAAHASVMQDYLVNQLRLNPDLFVSITDPYGNDLQFKGFLGQPAVQLLEGQLALTYTGAHKLAAMQAYNGSFYWFSNIWTYLHSAADVGLTEDFFKEGEDKSSIALRILAQLRKCHSAFVNGPQATLVKDLQSLHNINLNAFTHFIEPFLKASGDWCKIPWTGRSLVDGSQASPFNVADINYAICDAITSPMNFWQGLRPIMEMFKLQFRPNWDGTAILELLRTQDAPQGRYLKTAPENIGFNVAAAYELPLGKVYVRGPENNAYTYEQSASQAGLAPQVHMDDAGQVIAQMPNTGEGPLHGPNIVGYPPEDLPQNALKTVYLVDAPRWVTSDIFTYSAIQDKTDNGALDPKGAVNSLNEQTKQRWWQQQNRNDTLKWLAQFEYNEHFLKYTQAQVSMPFFVKVTVGKVYEVQDLGGNPLFIGYLHSLTHHLSSDATNPQARTLLNFTHIRMPEFSSALLTGIGKVLQG